MSHPAFTDEDKGFLRAILANPAELTAWLVYADWLDEHDDPRAAFVRLQVRFTAHDVNETERHRIAAQLERLRPTLDPDWVAIFDRPQVENCDEMFAFKCPRKWERLKGTDDPNVRHCDSCQKDVYYCSSRHAAYGHARLGHCVAVATGVDRFPGDLTPGEATGPSAVAGEMLMGFVQLERVRRHEPEPEPPKRPWWKFW